MTEYLMIWLSDDGKKLKRCEMGESSFVANLKYCRECEVPFVAYTKIEGKWERGARLMPEKVEPLITDELAR